MKTIVTFKVLIDKKIKRVNIPIEHDFKEIPQRGFRGVSLPPTTIDEQVIEMLDNMDKAEMMADHGWDVILDYEVRKPKKSKENEMQVFATFCEPYLAKFPQLRVAFVAVMKNSANVLFGKRKSNETKFMEVLSLIDTAYKASIGTMDWITSILNGNQKKLSI